jgi:hypothetical protein
MMKKLLLAAALLVVAGTILVASSGQARSCDCCNPVGGKPVNTMCPISGKSVSAVTTVWQGKKIAFCCTKCIEQWDNLGDDEKAEKLDR